MLITDDVFDAFLKCKTKAYLLSWATAGDRRASHPISDWQKHVAEDFKRECRDLLITDNPDGCFIGTPSPSDLIKGQYPLIVDPMVTFKDTASYIHALERLPLPLPKACNRYMPIRFIPSEKITKNHQLHLAFDAFVLGNTSGRMPILGKVIHGRHKKVKTIKLNELIRSVESLVDKIRGILVDNTPPDLVLIAHCSECAFEARCRSKATQKNDLSLLGGIKPKEVLKLRSRGIFTVTQLSYTFRPRRKSRRSNKETYPYHHSLKALAIREKRIYVAGTPYLDMGATPVYLDVEGIPDRDFYYLIGVRLPGVRSAIQRSFWADDDAGEERIWREFLNLIAETEKPKLYHYGSYETTFLSRMKKRYGRAVQGGISVDRLAEGARNILLQYMGISTSQRIPTV